MAENKKSFIMYLTQRPTFDGLSDEEAGQLIKTIFSYVSDENPKPTGIIKYAFEIIKPVLKADLVKYEDKRMKLKENISIRWNKKENKVIQTNTNEYNSIQNDSVIVNDIVNVIDIDNVDNKLLSNKENTTTINSSIKEKSAKSRFSAPTLKFGEYGRVVLNQEQYDKLVSEYNKDYIDKMIKALDEYVQSNNNKNKYKDFNLVLRKAIRENWFNIVDESDYGGFRML